SFIFQALKNQAPKLPAIVVPGNHQEDFDLKLIFPKENWPEKRSGTVLFQIDNGNELLPVTAKLGGSVPPSMLVFSPRRTRCSPASFRDTFAVDMLARGASPYDVAKLLGDTIERGVRQGATGAGLPHDGEQFYGATGVCRISAATWRKSGTDFNKAPV